MKVAKERPKFIVLFWKDMPRWDFKTARSSLFKNAHPEFRPLGDFAEESTEPIRPWDEPEKDWPVYGVNNDTGVFLNQYQKGKDFNAPYKRIRKDWFFHNPTRANVGSLGRVPEVSDDAITSPEYQIWRMKPGLLADFMEVLLQTDFFRDQIECHRVGAVKQRLFVQNLLEIPIPIFSEDQQQAVVNHWNNKQIEVSVAQQRIVKLEQDLENHILERVGISLMPPKSRSGAFAFRWNQFERWDTFFYREDFIKLEADLDSLAAQAIGEVAHFASRPWRKSDFPTGKFRYIEISSVAKAQGIVNCREVSVNEAPSRATTLVSTGDLLISTTRPYLGAFALVPPKFNNCVCTSGFAVVDTVKNKLLDKEFLLHFLKSQAGLRQMERRMTGGLYPAIVQSELEKVRIPLPSMKMQRDFVKAAKIVQSQIDGERQAAIQKGDTVKAEVEEMILGKRPFANGSNRQK